MYIYIGFTGMQTDIACVLDIICMGPGGGSPDGLLFPLLVSTEKLCFPKQMWAIYFLPNTSLRAIPELDWHTVYEKFMRGTVTPLIFVII